MDKLRAAYRIAVIIGLLIMASLVIYTVVVGMFENKTVELQGLVPMSGNDLEIMKFALLAVSAALFPLMRFISGKIINDTDGQVMTNASGPPSLAGVSPEFGKLVTAAVVTYALCEAPAIFGLVLYFLGRNSGDFYLFLMISLFFFATNFPRFSMWEEWYRRQTGGRQTRP